MKTTFFAILLSFVACKPSSESTLSDFRSSADSWTMVRKVGSKQDALERFLLPGANIDGNSISRSGSGFVIFGPYHTETNLSNFELTGGVHMTVNYIGNKKCMVPAYERAYPCHPPNNARYREACLNLQKYQNLDFATWEYDCPEPPGKVLIDIAMNDPVKGHGQNILGSREILVSNENRTASGFFAIDGSMTRDNTDLDGLEIRVYIISDWVKVSVDEARITATLFHK